MELVVPPLGESITEAVIASWLKQVGEAVVSGEIVLTLETDKVTVEIPAPNAGALTEQRVAAGDTVRVGQVLGTIDASRAGATV
ncbi:MAG: dihydrolipoamide succinyltransferase, partial [Deltaproteobacteria bacterium]|nr:dihydrolipoamide succinyltransferase [Deltaproteobacteria bacterium]